MPCQIMNVCEEFSAHLLTTVKEVVEKYFPGLEFRCNVAFIYRRCSVNETEISNSDVAEKI